MFVQQITIFVCTFIALSLAWEHKGWEQKEPEAPANYDFKYEVHDEQTGDIKRQSETASNGAIKGQYSLIDSDGYRRVVEYTADDHHGFQAEVKREPTHFKVPQPAPKIHAHAPAW
jgi:Insect cuticle protein